MAVKKSVAAALLLAAAALAVFLLRPRTPDFGRLRGGKDFNVILITVDTLRADKLGCYGSPRGKTPAIEALAAPGRRYENCTAQTAPTPPPPVSRWCVEP